MTLALMSPAQAAACESNHVCLYEHVDYGGASVSYVNGSEDMARFGPYFNDMTSSIKNNSGSTWCAYEHRNGGGARYTISPWTNYTWVGAWWDNKISSIRRRACW